MVQIVHKGSNEEKRKPILEAAQKRFAMMGYSKTSMIEIAKEVGISKAALYYYYPDKVALFTEVLKIEMDEFVSLMEGVRDRSDTMEAGLQAYVDLRISVFMKLVNLGRAAMSDIPGLSATLTPYLNVFGEREFAVVKDIMSLGAREGMFSDEVLDDLVRLYLDSLKGLTIVAMRERYKSDHLSQFKNDLKSQFNLFTRLLIQSRLK